MLTFALGLFWIIPLYAAKFTVRLNKRTETRDLLAKGYEQFVYRARYRLKRPGKTYRTMEREEGDLMPAPWSNSLVVSLACHAQEEDDGRIANISRSWLKWGIVREPTGVMLPNETDSMWL